MTGVAPTEHGWLAHLLSVVAICLQGGGKEWREEREEAVRCAARAARAAEVERHGCGGDVGSAAAAAANLSQRTRRLQTLHSSQSQPTCIVHNGTHVAVHLPPPLVPPPPGRLLPCLLAACCACGGARLGAHRPLRSPQPCVTSTLLDLRIGTLLLLARHEITQNRGPTTRQHGCLRLLLLLLQRAVLLQGVRVMPRHRRRPRACWLPIGNQGQAVGSAGFWHCLAASRGCCLRLLRRLEHLGVPPQAGALPPAGRRRQVALLLLLLLQGAKGWGP